MSGERMKGKLKPCAHCGSEAIGWLRTNDYGTATSVEIWCDNLRGCSAKMDFGLALNDELPSKIRRAKRQWNRRTPS